jgi:hypothetical protein
VCFVSVVLVLGGSVSSAILIAQQRLFFSSFVVWFLVIYQDGGLVFWSFDCWVFFGIWGEETIGGGGGFGLVVVVVVVECRGGEEREGEGGGGGVGAGGSSV